MARTACVRRSRCLVQYWSGRDFVVENYLSGGQVTTHPAVCGLLHELGNYAPESAVRRRFRALPDGMGVLETLLGEDIVVRQGSALDLKERAIDERWAWGVDARYLHYASRRLSYTFDFALIRANLERKAATTPPPSPFKTCAGERIALPPADDLGVPLGTCLRARRTHRTFASRPITLRHLSTILFWTWGKTHYYDGSPVDRRILKTSPSGGARHPIEVYVVADRLHDLPPAIYHYEVNDHSLVAIAAGGFAEHGICELFAGQPWVEQAAAAFVMTAMVQRSMWKYDHSRAYKVLHLDAGHVGQTFHLVCGALGLGPFTSAALDEDALERVLGVDGVDEVVLYGGAVGAIS